MLSFPFDWIYYSGYPRGTSDLHLRVDAICNGFKDWFRMEDLEIRPSPAGHNKDFYHNNRTHVTFNHDFPRGVPLADAFPTVWEKYERRISRLLRCLASSRRVLLVRVDPPPGRVPTAEADLRDARNRLSARFPKTSFDIVHFAYDEGRAFENRVETDLGDGLLRISFDYRDREPGRPDYEVNLAQTGGLLKRRFSVRDYRTLTERFRRQLPRWKSSFNKHLSPAILLAHLHRHRYAQIVPLGVNCETAFRFYVKWGFVDSSLLAWAQVFDLTTVTRALENLPSLFAGEASLHQQSGMWKCENLGILFHGQLKWNIGHPEYDTATLQNDLDSLKGRVAHLREKLISYLTNEKETLLIHRLAESDEKRDDLEARLTRLEDAISKLGARNWKLLVITRKAALGRMPPGPHRIFRAVRVFNPCDRVTDSAAGDPIGWRAIFTEFAPRTILPKKHAFKFE